MPRPLDPIPVALFAAALLPAARARAAEAKKAASEQVPLLETKRFVDTKKRPAVGWQLPEPRRPGRGAKRPARVFRWGFVDIEAEKKARLAQYDRAIAHWEEEAKKAEGDAKEKLEFKLTSLRAARAQEIAFYANLRCKVELIGDPRTRIAVYSQPLSKKVRLYDFVRNLRRSLERDFSGLKLTENGVRDRRFQRQGWEGVRFTGEGTPKQDPEKERRWIRLLHYRKVTKQGRGMHVWIHGFAPTWRVERDFLLEVERLLAGLRVSG